VPPSSSVHVVLYATAREAAGRARIDLPVPARGTSVAALLKTLGRTHSGLIGVLPTCRVARNGRYVVPRTAHVRPGDEVAIHPPYSGG